jgi:hypothetical protein
MENPGGPDIDTVRETLRQRDEQVTGGDEGEAPDVAEPDEGHEDTPDNRGREETEGGG